MPRVDPASVRATPLASERARGATVLLIVDMLSAWDFPDAEKLLPGASRIAPRIAALRQRCKRATVPVVYANDNHGRWRSDFREIVGMAGREGSAGAAICKQLAPDEQDYFVLKPKHSAFYETPLDLLCRHLRASRLIVTGVSSDQCVLMTAVDARMRDYEVHVPRDAVATQSASRQALAMRYLDDVLEVKTTPSQRLRLPRPP
jgi:nicotinamidase-related amidase